MERVGFIGVGMMGGGIAGRMIENGVPVLAFDNNPATLDGMVERGATPAASVKEVVDSAEIVFACLPDANICRAVALEPGGVADGEKVEVYIETSSLGGNAVIEIADELARRGITLLDSPIVGGLPALEAGTLGVLTAGPSDTLERARYALEAFAGRLFHLGEEAGMGQAGKVVNNSVAYASLLATCEAVAVGMKAGLSMETAVDIINQGSGKNFFSETIFPNLIMKGIFEGTGAIEIGVKDVKLFLAEAQRLGIEPPVASAVSGLQEMVVESGPAGRDTMTYFHYFSDLVGLPRQG
jgi:3-hydroxyisobutyrate dehydrogenase-like beta-hydroxyacid dehydrogenase